MMDLSDVIIPNTVESGRQGNVEGGGEDEDPFWS